MKITVNGEARDVTVGTSISALLESLAVSPKTVVVQCNEDIVDREAYRDTLLSDGDILELVRFVGGG